MSSTRLPPIPDDLLAPEKHEQVIGFIRGLIIPGRYKASLLAQWGKMVGVEITPTEFAAVRGRFRGEE